MRSIGLDLAKYLDRDLLRVVAARPSMYGLEMHLAIVLKAIKDFAPQSAVIDPISSLVRAGGAGDALDGRSID